MKKSTGFLPPSPAAQGVIGSTPDAAGDPDAAFSIDRSAKEGLVQQVAGKVRQLIDNGTVLPGTKLPSVREMARQLGVSTFTVAAAYDLLVARHVISTRPGSGYFVLSKASAPPAAATACKPAAPVSISDFWLSLDVFAYGRQLASPGCGWLPSSWYEDNELLGDAMRRVARIKPDKLAGYGHPAGYGQLRQHIAYALSDQHHAITTDQIILTHGATHAIDLVMRTFLQAGDAVLVEDPCYSNLLGLMERHQCTTLPVARTGMGLDLEAVARYAEKHRPKMMFVMSVLQNPLGTTLRPVEAHRLLALAEKYDFVIVEDDIFRPLAPTAGPCLAAMDGFSRVISVNGFSKTIAPSLRVGYLACGQAHVDLLLRTKMVSGLTTSELSERVAFAYLSDARHRRILSRVRDRLIGAQASCRQSLLHAGLTLMAEPDGGMFVCAGWPVRPDAEVSARSIAEDALSHGIVLAPGSFFKTASCDMIWFRFNVAHGENANLQDYLKRISDKLN